MNTWYLLILSLPTAHTALRQRCWRAARASGAVALRDGVYLLPQQPRGRDALQDIATDVEQGGGSAWLLSVENSADADFARLFDRSADYAALQTETAVLRAVLTDATAHETLRQLRKLNKTFMALGAIDFFPTAAREQTEAALLALTSAANRLLSPDEPHPTAVAIKQLDRKDYQKRLWATRQRPWIDRLASAWLITRFIDSSARFQWLTTPADCPSDALGFDFDGAAFTHVDDKVTFEVLLASFVLHDAALQRIAAIVHYLDAGGVAVPEATGVETVLAGLRKQIQDDDALLAQSFSVFDGLLAAFASVQTTKG